MSRKYLLGCSANDAIWADDVQGCPPLIQLNESYVE